MKIKDFLKGQITYDKDSQQIFVIQPNGHSQLIVEVRGWGAIQNLFKNRAGVIDFSRAADFQDELSMFIKEAIEEKLEKI